MFFMERDDHSDEQIRDILSLKKVAVIGIKVEIVITENGSKEVDKQIHELQARWNQMVSLYKTKDKENLKQYMNESKSFLPMMIFFGVMDMMMFSMMFSIIGMTMSNYVPTENMPEGADRAIDEGEFDTDVEF